MNKIIFLNHPLFKVFFKAWQGYGIKKKTYELAALKNGIIKQCNGNCFLGFCFVLFCIMHRHCYML